MDRSQQAQLEDGTSSTSSRGGHRPINNSERGRSSMRGVLVRGASQAAPGLRNRSVSLGQRPTTVHGASLSRGTGRTHPQQTTSEAATGLGARSSSLGQRPTTVGPVNETLPSTRPISQPPHSRAAAEPVPSTSRSTSLERLPKPGHHAEQTAICRLLESTDLFEEDPRNNLGGELEEIYKELVNAVLEEPRKTSSEKIQKDRLCVRNLIGRKEVKDILYGLLLDPTNLAKKFPVKWMVTLSHQTAIRKKIAKMFADVVHTNFLIPVLEEVFPIEGPHSGTVENICNRLYPSKFLKLAKKDDANYGILGRILALILVLDWSYVHLGHNLELLNSFESNIVSSETLLNQVFNLLDLQKENGSKRLNRLGFVLRYYNPYRSCLPPCIHDFSKDFEDGIVFVRMLEVLSIAPHLKAQLVVPAHTINNKKKNICLVLKAMGISNETLNPVDLVMGSLPATLYLIWKMGHKFKTTFLDAAANVIQCAWKCYHARQTLASLQRNRQEFGGVLVCFVLNVSVLTFVQGCWYLVSGRKWRLELWTGHLLVLREFEHCGRRGISIKCYHIATCVIESRLHKGQRIC